MKETFLSLIAECIEREANDINETDRFRDYEEWDSLAVLSLIAMIKQNFDIIIPRKDFDSLYTIEELYNYIQGQKK